MSTGSKETARRSKIVSKILSIFARIGNICCWIGVVATVIGAVAIASVAPNISIDKNAKEITIFDERKSYNIEAGEFTLDDSEIIKLNISSENATEIENFIEDNLMVVVWLVVAMLAGGAIMLVIGAFVFDHAAKLFKNIANKNTPFIKENTEHLEKTFKLLVIELICSFIMSLAIVLVTGVDSFTFETTSISTILVVYVVAYIFRSGYELQEKKAKKTEE